MKYFIGKRKDCISSFLLAGGREKKWRRGIKKNVFFLETTACVCDEWRGIVRIGCWWKEGGRKNVENVDVVSIVVEREIR
jgi:hypothetical protein